LQTIDTIAQLNITMAPTEKLNILITGCSPGGMGAALAVAFHNAGHHVYATARNPAKLSTLAEQGIQTVTLDVTSSTSIESAVSAVTASLPPTKGLDILVNNAAGNYTMPVVDATLPAARELFDLNVWAQLAVTQAFLPLLLRSTNTSSGSPKPDSDFQPLIVNHTSVGSKAALPFQGIYNASKAALAMLTSTMRMELAPFGIRVVDLKTAGVKTNIIANSNFNSAPAGGGGGGEGERLPAGSIFAPAREVVERIMSQEGLADRGITAEQWAGEVVGVLLGRNPPAEIWKGESALVARMAMSIPCDLAQSVVKKMTGLGEVEEIIKKARQG
jgi:NAD(P)-dependent dehydrogenase (short-subunit alcohol dehydrogenase family)